MFGLDLIKGRPLGREFEISRFSIQWRGEGSQIGGLVYFNLYSDEPAISLKLNMIELHSSLIQSVSRGL